MQSTSLLRTAGACSTSGRTGTPRTIPASLRVCAAKDVMCKDVVNVRKQAVLQGQATVVFAGVEGQEQAVPCAKVN